MGDMADYITDQNEYGDDEYAGCWVCMKCYVTNDDEDADCYRCQQPRSTPISPSTEDATNG